VRLICGDCLEVLPTLADESVDLIFCDPPYNIGIFSKMPPDEYLAWCEAWIAECSRVLAANGAFWVSHKAPDVLVELSRMIAARGRKRINWVTWDKYNGAGDLQGFMDGYTVVESLRSFQVMAEYLIYHADNLAIALNLKNKRLHSGLTCDAIERRMGYVDNQGRGSRLFYRWEKGDSLPTLADFCLATLICRGLIVRQLDLSLHSELRRDYEDLRYTFNNPGKVSSVWQIPPAASNGHPTPKPEALLERIILATSNPGDVVLDPFVGSGTTGAVAARLGREFTGIDISEKWVAFSEKRIAEAQAQPTLEGLA